MAIADTQKIDYLWKKLGYGVAKTDTDVNKKAYEEAIASPLLLRGDKLWAQSGNIPATIPTATTSLVTLYKDGTGSWTHTVECTEDTTASDNKTWKTNLNDWVPVEFGSTYQVQVYIDAVGAANPQTTGTKIFAAGSGNNDEWYFDYQAGVLHFIGANIPTSITTGVTGKTIYVSGARYAGTLGFSGSVSSDSANLGNLNITGFTISSVDANSNIILDPNGTGNISLAANTAVTGNLTVSLNANLGNVATANFFTGTLTTSAQPNITTVGNLTTLTTVGNATIGNNLTVTGNLTVLGLTTTINNEVVNQSETITGNLTVTLDSLLGNVATANFFTGTLTTHAQPNITSVGNLVNLNVAGNIVLGNGISANGSFGNKFDVLSSTGNGKTEWKGHYFYTTTMYDFTEYGMGYMNMAPNQDPTTFGFIPGVEIPYGSVWMLVTNDGSDISPTVTSPNSKSTPMMWTSLDGSGAYDPDTNPTGGDYWFNITPPSA